MLGVSDILRRRGLLNETTSFKDVVSDEDHKPYYGFCLNEKCKPLHRRYLVDKSNKGRMEGKRKSQVSCNSCMHALYWSNKYRETDERERDPNTNYPFSGS
jgi:hypothetical protein